MWSNILFTINTVTPVFIIILIGIFLKKIHFIKDEFINQGSKIVFNVALPSLIFSKISKADFGQIANFGELGFGVVGIIISYLILAILSFSIIKVLP